MVFQREALTGTSRLTNTRFILFALQATTSTTIQAIAFPEAILMQATTSTTTRAIDTCIYERYHLLDKKL